MAQNTFITTLKKLIRRIVREELDKQSSIPAGAIQEAYEAALSRRPQT